MALQTYNSAVWQGGDSGNENDYQTADNWEPHSIRTAALKWTASGSGTNEYYLEILAGGDPLIGTEPAKVYETATGTPAALAAGTAGSLAAGEWDWADNDTLGFSTVYVRLTDEGDPDGDDFDSVTFVRVPIANDDVTLSAESSNAITVGLENRSIELDNFVVEEGYTSAIGVAPAANAAAKYLHIDQGAADSFRFAGGGISYTDYGTANGDVTITKTAQNSEGRHGLYLIGTGFDNVFVTGRSNVGIAALPGEVSTIGGTLTVKGGAYVELGEAVTNSAASIYVYDGTLRSYSSLTTVEVYDGGVLELYGAAGYTTVTMHPGSIVRHFSSGNGTTVVAWGGLFDTFGNKLAKTIGTIQVKAALDLVLNLDTDIVTLTNPLDVSALGPYQVSFGQSGGGQILNL